ncbi:MAG: FlgD immunoglobulin-like domain containing protein [Candidatus Eisenbacteria bacterium]
MVRTLTGTGGPGFNAWSWDGRDEAGREVPAGAYYVRLSEPGASDHVLAQARAIRLR